MRAAIERVTGARDLLIRLRIEGEFAFDAGQYLEIVLAQGVRIPLSIASAPADLPSLELVYRSTPGDPLAQALDRALAARAPLTLAPAAGSVRVTNSVGPLLLVAGGTGIGQARSIVRHLASISRRITGRITLRSTEPGATTLLWCLDEPPEDHLARDIARELDRHPESRLWTCVDPDRTPANRGLVWLREHLADPARPSYARAIIAGSPAFVHAVADLIEGAGVPAPESDVFAFAPR